VHLHPGSASSWCTYILELSCIACSQCSCILVNSIYSLFYLFSICILVHLIYCLFFSICIRVHLIYCLFHPLPIPSFLYLRCCVFYVLHCLTIYCIVLQCGASCCSKLQRLVVPKEAGAAGDRYWHVLSIRVAVCCIVLQCVAW